MSTARSEEKRAGSALRGKHTTREREAFQEVMRSSWTAELRRINSVHRGYRAETWDGYRHYLLAFHDETFECVAKSFTVETRRTTFAHACREALGDLSGKTSFR